MTIEDEQVLDRTVDEVARRLVRRRAQRGGDLRDQLEEAGHVVEGPVTGKVRDGKVPRTEAAGPKFCAGLRPFPTYTDDPTTTPHDVNGVRRRHAVRIDVVEAAAPILLGFLSADLPRPPGPLGGPARIPGRPVGARPFAVVTRAGEESPEAVTAPAGDAPAALGVDLIMSRRPTGTTGWAGLRS